MMPARQVHEILERAIRPDGFALVFVAEFRD
jgi:hypothetical protein